MYKFFFLVICAALVGYQLNASAESSYEGDGSASGQIKHQRACLCRYTDGPFKCPIEFPNIIFIHHTYTLVPPMKIGDSCEDVVSCCDEKECIAPFKLTGKIAEPCGLISD